VIRDSPNDCFRTRHYIFLDAIFVVFIAEISSVAHLQAALLFATDQIEHVVAVWENGSAAVFKQLFLQTGKIQF
jgi:hypothetical protein